VSPRMEVLELLPYHRYRRRRGWVECLLRQRWQCEFGMISGRRGTRMKTQGSGCRTTGHLAVNQIVLSKISGERWWPADY